MNDPKSKDMPGQTGKFGNMMIFSEMLKHEASYN